MSTKMKLSDDVMENITGGTLTYGGREISMIHGTPKGAAVTYADGERELLEWKDEYKPMMEEKGRDAIRLIVDRQEEIRYKGTYTLDDYVK